MDYDEFEGFKKIKNEKNYKIEQLYEIIKQYQEATGEVKYGTYNNELKIVVDVEGKYYIDIYLKNNDIIIERKLEPGFTEATSIMKDSKSLALAHADRMVEQIYDLIKEFIKTGKVTEKITKAKEIFYVKESEKKFLKGAISFGKIFIVEDENQKQVYEISQSLVNQSFSIRNNETKREEGSLIYKEKEQNKFSILKSPYELINLEKDINSAKFKFKSTNSKKELEISGDYTDNHYLVEYNKIVIGSIDCLDPTLKQNYRVEINDLNYVYILLAIVALIDINSEINI